jgi:3-dehydroquinate synthetase
MLLPHSVKIKLAVVTRDPFEKGLRKTLNAGHTIGHAVETFLLQSDRKVLHGEAIAIGLICEAFLAHEKGMLGEDDFKDITRYLLKVFGKVSLVPKEDEAIAKLTAQDKKNKDNKIMCVLLEGIGNAKWDCEIRLRDQTGRGKKGSDILPFSLEIIGFSFIINGFLSFDRFLDAGGPGGNEFFRFLFPGSCQ